MATYEWIGGTGVFQTGSNWSPSGPPASGDTAIFNHRGTLGLTGADHSGSVTLTNLFIDKSFLYGIGDATTPFKIGATNYRICFNPDPSQSFAGPTRVNLDLAAIESHGVVYDTGIAITDTGKENVRIKGTHAANTISILGGQQAVGIATTTGDTANFATMYINGGRVNIGSGTTIGLTSIGGNAQCTFQASPGTLTLGGSANLTTYGDFTIPVATIDGGTWTVSNRQDSGNSITTLTQNGGVLDFSKDPRTLTLQSFVQGQGTVRVFSSGQLGITSLTLASTNLLNRTVSLS